LFLTVAIPTYNERETLFRVAGELVLAARRLGRPFEILIVDDGSTDGSGAVADQVAAVTPEARVIRHPENLGLGGVYRTVFQEARGEYLTSFPADGQFPPTILDAFGPLIESHDLVLGYLPRGQQNFIERTLSEGERWLYRLLLGPIPKFQGVFLIRRALVDAMNLQSSGRGWAIVMELIIKVARHPGSRLVGVPIVMIPRESGQSKVRNVRTIVANFRQIARLRSIVTRARGADDSTGAA